MVGKCACVCLAKYAFKEKHPETSEKYSEYRWRNLAFGTDSLLLLLDDHYNFIYYGGMLLVSLLCVVLVAVTAHPEQV